MNEDYIQDQKVMPDPASAVSQDLSTVSGNDALSPPGEASADGGKSRNEGSIFGMVSDDILSGLEISQEECIEVQDIFSDMAASLQKIDYTLTAILAFLVFRFCFERIRSGVKSITGRGL